MVMITSDIFKTTTLCHKTIEPVSLMKNVTYYAKTVHVTAANVTSQALTGRLQLDVTCDWELGTRFSHKSCETCRPYSC